MPPKRKQLHGEIAEDASSHFKSAKKIKPDRNPATQLTPISNNKRKQPTSEDTGSPSPAKKLKLKLNLTPPRTAAEILQAPVTNDTSSESRSTEETVSVTPAKKLELKLNLSPEPKHAEKTEEAPHSKHPINEEILPSTPAKKVKLTLKLSPESASATPTTKQANTSVRKPPGTTSTLVPRGSRKKAILGHPDPSILRMVCDCTLTGKTTELHFRKIPHSTINWNSAYHVSKINAWRNQIYGRAGLKAKSVTVWHETEELWFELYFQLSIVAARTKGIMLPSSKIVRDKFNEMFVGAVLQDRDGGDLEPRAERLGNAFASKFNRVCPVLRARLHQCVFGRVGDVFVPEITFAMLERYRGLKEGMKALGLEKESEYADGLGEWRRFLSQVGDGEYEVLGLTEEEVMEAKEEDAVAALMSLANSPANAVETTAV